MFHRTDVIPFGGTKKKNERDKNYEETTSDYEPLNDTSVVSDLSVDSLHTSFPLSSLPCLSSLSVKEEATKPTILQDTTQIVHTVVHKQKEEAIVQQFNSKLKIYENEETDQEEKKKKACIMNLFDILFNYMDMEKLNSEQTIEMKRILCCVIDKLQDETIIMEDEAKFDDYWCKLKELKEKMKKLPEDAGKELEINAEKIEKFQESIIEQEESVPHWNRPIATEDTTLNKKKKKKSVLSIASKLKSIFRLKGGAKQQLYLCPFCNKSKSIANRARHEKSCSKKETIFCPTCNKELKKKNQKRHILACEEAKRRIEALKQEPKQQKMAICPVCNVEQPRKNLQRHIDMCKKPKEKDHQFRCPICREMKSLRNQKRHLESCLKNLPEPEEELNENDDSSNDGVGIGCPDPLDTQTNHIENSSVSSVMGTHDLPPTENSCSIESAAGTTFFAAGFQTITIQTTKDWAAQNVVSIDKPKYYDLRDQEWELSRNILTEQRRRHSLVGLTLQQILKNNHPKISKEDLYAILGIWRDQFTFKGEEIFLAMDKVTMRPEMLNLTGLNRRRKLVLSHEKNRWPVASKTLRYRRFSPEKIKTKRLMPILMGKGVYTSKVFKNKKGRRHLVGQELTMENIRQKEERKKIEERLKNREWKKANYLEKAKEVKAFFYENHLHSESGQFRTPRKWEISEVCRRVGIKREDLEELLTHLPGWLEKETAAGRTVLSLKEKRDMEEVRDNLSKSIDEMADHDANVENLFEIHLEQVRRKEGEQMARAFSSQIRLRNNLCGPSAQSCYTNVTMHILKIIGFKKFLEKDGPHRNGPISKILLNLLTGGGIKDTTLLRERFAEVHGIEWKANWDGAAWVAQQQDANEFRDMLIKLVEEEKKIEFNNHRHNEITQRIFLQDQKYDASCLNCKRNPDRTQSPIDYVGIHLNDCKDGVELSTLLKKQYEDDRPLNLLDMKCDRCSFDKYQKAREKTSLNPIGEYLICYLSRTPDHNLPKINTKVVLSEKILLNNEEYTVIGTINHEGETRSGHYYCFTKKRNVWFKHEDMSLEICPNFSEIQNNVSTVILKRKKNNTSQYTDIIHEADELDNTCDSEDEYTEKDSNMPESESVSGRDDHSSDDEDIEDAFTSPQTSIPFGNKKLPYGEPSEEDSDTPEVDLCPLSKYKDAQQALSVSVMPAKIHGREVQLRDIENWMKDWNWSPKSLILSGCPGTGKTGSLMRVIEEKAGQGFRTLTVVCVNYSKPKHVFGEIFNFLNIPFKWRNLKESTILLVNVLARSERLLVLLDEVDFLQNFADFFRWMYVASKLAPLRVVGMSNKLDITNGLDREMFTLVEFPVYTAREISMSIQEMLKQHTESNKNADAQIIPEDVIKLVANIVAKESGDMRNAIHRLKEQLTKKINEANKNNRSAVRYLKVSDILSSMSEGSGTVPADLVGITTQPKIVLACMVCMVSFKKTKIFDLKLLEEKSNIARRKFFRIGFSGSEFLDCCQMLHKFITIEVEIASKKKKVTLIRSETELAHVLRDHGICRRILDPKFLFSS